jgi:hypothetical protein
MVAKGERNTKAVILNRARVLESGGRRMKLIDADKLLHQGYDYVVDGIAYDSCNKSMDIEGIPTVQAIPLEKVKQAREEIQKLRGCSCSCSDGIIDDVEDILDKLIESEG